MKIDIYDKELRMRRRKRKRLIAKIRSYVEMTLVLTVVICAVWGVISLGKGVAVTVSAEEAMYEDFAGISEATIWNVLGIYTDSTAPEITGVEDITAYQGEAISYRKGILVTDDQDTAPQLSVDASQVDLSKPGTYTVRYTAADLKGNTAESSAEVTVLERGESFEDLAVIESAIDAVLQGIIKEGMTTRQQVEAIYDWARDNLKYTGHSDRTDYRQTAYTVLQELQGDCYGFYAVTKLMLERLDIPNIDVQKVRNFADDSDHFWSLVSVDGGETYYHFDATPRIGAGDNFCLVTDEVLDAYSREHENSHNRNVYLYPATPKESL